VNAVGTHWITHREIDTEAVTRSRVVVDSRDANEAECGDLMIPVAEGAIGRAHFEVELGQVVNGDRPGRQTKDEITMYQLGSERAHLACLRSFQGSETGSNWLRWVQNGVQNSRLPRQQY
jgi:hypothetical protein